MRKISPSHRIRRMIRKPDSAFHPKHDSYKWWLLANVMIGTFMAVLDSTIVNVGLPKIMASFGVGIDKIEWVLTAYMLALAVMLPTSGWLADRFGYKRMYFLGILIFTFGSFLCGMSGDENTLILSRVVQGLGAGIIMPLGMAIISREFPPHQRGMALGFWAISAAASVSFGPLIGGYLVDNFNLPIGLLGLVATIVIQKEYINKNVKSFDLWGFLSVSLFLPLILYALAEGSAMTNTEGWSATYVVVCIAISLIAFVAFITIELIVEHPLIDLKLFKYHNFAVSNLVMFIFGIGMFGSTFLLPLYLQNSLGYTAIQAGAVFLPVGIIQGAVSPIIGKIADKTNAKIPILLGVILLAFSFYLNSNMSFLTEHGAVMVTLYLRGFSMGIMFTPLSTISLMEMPREKMAQASGIINVIRQLGGSFGVAILATLLITRVSYHTEMFGESVNPRSETYQAVSAKAKQQLITHSGSSPASAARLSNAIIVGQLNKEAYITAIDDDFLAACFFTLIGGIPVLFLRVKKKTPPTKTIQHE
jgi:DHA2 family multidrug resistance protein